MRQIVAAILLLTLGGCHLHMHFHNGTGPTQTIEPDNGEGIAFTVPAEPEGFK